MGTDLNFFETSNGLKYAALANLDELAKLGELDAYDQTVAESHLYNYGAIFVGEFCDVLDNEYDIADAAAHYEMVR